MRETAEICGQSGREGEAIETGAEAGICAACKKQCDETCIYVARNRR